MIQHNKQEQIFSIDYICWHGEEKSRQCDEIPAASADEAMKIWLSDNNREDISCEITADGACRFSEPDDFDTDGELWVRDDMFYCRVRISGPHAEITCPTCRGAGKVMEL